MYPSLNEKRKCYSTYACGQDCVFYIETTYISCHVEINKQVWSMQPIPLSHLFCATKNWQTRRRLGLFVAHHNWPKWFWKFLSIWLANMVASGSQLSSTSIREIYWGLFRMTYSKALRYTFFGEWKNSCSSNSCNFCYLIGWKARWSKNRAAQGFTT